MMRRDPARRTGVEAGLAAFVPGFDRGPQVAHYREPRDEFPPAERAQNVAVPRLRIERSGIVGTERFPLEHGAI